MKLARRRSAADPDPSSHQPSDQPPAPPTPPRGAPVASFAGVLDGQSLWLAVGAGPGALALREVGSGDVVALASDLVEDQVEHRSVRVDLDGLALTGEAAYDVVLVPSGGRAPRQVWSAPLPPARVPTHDGHRWQVVRDDAGLLGLRRRAVAPHVELAAISAGPDGLHLTVEPPAPLVLRAEDGTEVARLSGEPTPGLLTVEAVADVADQTVHVTTDDGRPVLRRDHDLLNPARGAPLPELYSPGDGVRDPLGLVRVRLRWSDTGALVARVLDPEVSA